MNRQRGEKGQVMVAAAGLLFLFVLVAAVVLNVGWWLHDKRDAQNDVDAAVLAGAQELPDTGTASAMAEAWAASNGAVLDCSTDCSFEDLSDDGEADLIRATLEREPGSLADRLLDVGIVTVTVKAAAAKQRAVAGCVTPWAIDGDETLGPENYWGLQPEDLFIFHTSEFLEPGNFGALAIYGNGATDYKAAITTPCGGGGGACDQEDPYVPVGGSLVCEVKTGNMGQNTDDALTDRYGEGSACDVATYDEAVAQAATDPIEECGDRAVLVPIIDAFPTQGHSDPIDILGLATFYIAGWDRVNPYGDEDIDGDTVSDDAMVWGYFLRDEDVIEAWNIQWGYSDDPFAPTRVLLVE